MGLRFFTPLRYVQNDMVESAAPMDSGFRRNDVIDARKSRSVSSSHSARGGGWDHSHHSKSWQSWLTRQTGS